MALSPLLGVVDLGSNSFRMFVARVATDRGGLRRIDVVAELKESVRLAAGLGADARLDAAAQSRGVAALAKFREHFRLHRPGAIRAVATNTLRVAINANEFLGAAQVALGNPIDVISGRDEARLIYRGASQALGRGAGRRLVIDIGGGSTEFIVGEQDRIEALDSVGIGCVGMTQRFFADGRVDASRWDAALEAAHAALAPAMRALRWQRWEAAWGTSGTFKALVRTARLVTGQDTLTREGIRGLRDRLVEAGELGRVQFEGLKDDRRPVIAGGLVVANAAFDLLPVEPLRYAPGALREGVLLDLADRVMQRRERAVAA